MIRRIAIAVAALTILGGSASAFPPDKLATNGTHFDGLRTAIPAGAVKAIVLPAGTTIAVR